MLHSPPVARRRRGCKAWPQRASKQGCQATLVHAAGSLHSPWFPTPRHPPHSPGVSPPAPPAPTPKALQVLLIENDINTNPFTSAVHACVPPLPWSVSDADLADSSRADLRHLAVCSVDPPGCKDIDDALHVRKLPDGNYELGEGAVYVCGRGRCHGKQAARACQAAWLLRPSAARLSTPPRARIRFCAVLHCFP